MTKRKKGLLISVAAVLVLVLIFLSVFIVKEFYYADADYYEKNWGIQLPNNMRELYSESNLGFTGDGAEYTILQTKEFSAEELAEFTKGPDKRFENMINEIISEWLSIPDDKYPDWERDYYWRVVEKDIQTTAYLCMMYLPDSKQIIIASFVV